MPPAPSTRTTRYGPIGTVGTGSSIALREEPSEAGVLMNDPARS